MTQSVAYPTHPAPVPAKGSLKTAPETFALIPNPQTQTADESSRLGRVCLAVADSVETFDDDYPYLAASALVSALGRQRGGANPVMADYQRPPPAANTAADRQQREQPARQRDRDARSQVDRLFDELTRDPAPRKR
jgi:hypothetical protein